MSDPTRSTAADPSFRDVTAEEPCPVEGCGATSGCRIAEDKSLAACLNVRGVLSWPKTSTRNRLTYNVHPLSPAAVIEAGLRILLEEGQVTELRAIAVSKPGYRKKHIEAGYFDFEHIGEMANCAAWLSKLSQGVYFTLNPLDPEIVHRRYNRVDVADERDMQATDVHVVRRRWLLIDTDAERLSNISSTEEEKKATYEVILEVRDHLRRMGWPDPILGDSGNGYHGLWRIDLPADDGGTVKRLLHALAARFDRDKVKIDTSVFNPSRICKLPGTLARKGDSTPKRPHRMAKLLEVPGRE
jgi:hypothetical protein